MARDTSFYYSFLVLPPDKRDAIVAVWDFCRAVDDEVDEMNEVDEVDVVDAVHEVDKIDRVDKIDVDKVGTVKAATDPASAATRLSRWRREVAACFGDGQPVTPQGRALAPLVARFGLPRQPFEDLIDGVEMDLGPRRYETFNDLYQYCIRVASAVGLICLEIFGYRQPGARAYAIDLGVALQLTNILRDVPTDLKMGRIYLPQVELRAHGCSEQDLHDETRLAGGGVRSAAVRSLLEAQAARARAYYARAAAALPRADARSLVAAEIMRAIYRALLDRIERRDYDVFSEVVRVPRPWRAAIALATWLRVRWLS